MSFFQIFTPNSRIVNIPAIGCREMPLKQPQWREMEHLCEQHLPIGDCAEPENPASQNRPKSINQRK